MTERANAGILLAAAGALALFVSLFIDWYERGLSAWTVFEVVDVVLAGIAVLVLLAAVSELTRFRMGFDLERFLPVVGIGSLLLVVVSIVNNPPAAQGLEEAAGAWIALAGAILIGIGAVLAQRRISVIISTSPRQHRSPSWAEPRSPTGSATEPPGSEEVTRPNNPVDRA